MKDRKTEQAFQVLAENDFNSVEFTDRIVLGKIYVSSQKSRQNLLCQNNRSFCGNQCGKRLEHVGE